MQVSTHPNKKVGRRGIHNISVECLTNDCDGCERENCSCVCHQPLSAREKRIRGIEWVAQLQKPRKNC